VLPLAVYVVFSLLGLARADTVEGGDVRIKFRSSIAPRALPRAHSVPVALHLAGKVRPTGGERPTGLRRLIVQVNRYATFDIRGLPRCAPRELRGTTTRDALSACREALVGTGTFRSHIDIAEQAPFPAVGRVLAFNSGSRRHPALTIHVFGTRPVAVSTVVSGGFLRTGAASGDFGPQITIEMPRIGDDWGFVSGFDLTLDRRYRYGGKEKSLVSARCPAPADVRVVPFKAARATFVLSDGRIFSRTVNSTCIAAD
jgi:hypothetical protein